MLCYAVTPLLQRFRRRADILLPVLLLAAIAEYAWIRWHVFWFSWFFLYAVGYYWPLADRRLRHMLGILLPVGFLCLLTQFDWSIVRLPGNPLNRTLHDTAGLLIVLFGIPLFGRLFKSRPLPTAVRLFDRYSYEIYLTHILFLKSPFTLMECSPWPALNATFVVALTLALAWLLKQVSGLAERCLTR